jgi:hypothetical protein
MDELNHLGWVVQRSYEIGPWIFGIRTNSEAVGDWLDATLDEFEVGDPTEAVYSILVAEDGKRIGKRFHVLYDESRVHVRSFSLAHIGRRLLAELEGFAAADRTDALYAKMALMRYGERVGLVPSLLVPYLLMLGSRAERRGLHMPDHTFVGIDLETGLVRSDVRPILPIDIDAAARALAAVDPDGPPDEPEPLGPPVAPDVLYSIGLEDDPVIHLGPAHAAYLAAHHAVNLIALRSAGLDALGRLAERTRCLEIRSSNTRETLELLCQTLADPDAPVQLPDER